MAKIQAPEGFEIGALKKKTQQGYNLLAPGPGTPWEDRGTTGVIPAFFKTTIMSLKSPNALLAAIRRPETTGDLMGLRIGYSILWIISAVIHTFIWKFAGKIDDATVTRAFIFSVGIGAAAWLGFMLFSAMFTKLLSAESKTPVPAPLVQNVVGYCMGPSILAPIPLVGPAAAILGMVVVGITAGGAGRLHLRTGGAIVTVILTSIVTGVVVAGGGFAFWYVLGLWLGA